MFEATQSTLTKCLQLYDELLILRVLPATTPFSTADVDGSGGVWSTTTSAIPGQIQSCITNFGDRLDSVLLTFGHYNEFCANTALVGQFGGNTGFGRLTDAQAASAFASFGVENIYVFRSETVGTVSDVVFFQSGGIIMTQIPGPGANELGISLSEAPVPNTHDGVMSYYAYCVADIVVNTDMGVRLADV
jgi:hypothetical protein